MPAHPAGRRWVGVGHSLLPDSRAAAGEAAREALSGEDPCLLMAFFASSYDPQAVADALVEIAEDVPVIGCSTAGEISAASPRDASVVVIALGGPGFAASTRGSEAEGPGLRGASAQAAACLDDVEGCDYQAVLLLADGMASDQRDVVRGAYETVGAGIPIVGGFAGDGMTFTGTTLIRGDRVLRTGTVAAAIGSDAPIGIGVEHGWTGVGASLRVTASVDGTLISLDDEPALDAYLRVLDAPTEVGDDPVAFAAFAQRHPLSLQRRRSDEVRYTAAADFTARTLSVGTQIPVGAKVQVLVGGEASILGAARAASQAAVTGLAPHDPLGLVVFDCAARREILGSEGAAEELSVLAAAAEGTPMAGFYSYGEIARVDGGAGVHNQTVVVVALA